MHLMGSDTSLCAHGWEEPGGVRSSQRTGLPAALFPWPPAAGRFAQLGSDTCVCFLFHPEMQGEVTTTEWPALPCPSMFIFRALPPPQREVCTCYGDMHMVWPCPQTEPNRVGPAHGGHSPGLAAPRCCPSSTQARTWQSSPGGGDEAGGGQGWQAFAFAGIYSSEALSAGKWKPEPISVSWGVIERTVENLLLF